MAGSTPTQRSTAYCREQGWPYGIVEHWVPMWETGEGSVCRGGPLGQRRDLWGCIDILVLDDEPGNLGVQACAGSSHAARMKKMLMTITGQAPAGATKATHANAERKGVALRRWLAKGNRLEVWSWSKTGERGKRKLWTLRREGVVMFRGDPIQYQENLEVP